MKKINVDMYTKELIDIKKSHIEELYLITKYSFENLFYYIQNKKSKSNVPKLCIGAIKEFKRIIKEERKIVNFLQNHLEYIEENNLEEFIEKLDDLNELTIKYFYEYFEQIEDAIDLDNSFIKTSKDFLFLPDNLEIKSEASNLIFSKGFIKDYLGFEEEFWTFIDARTVFSKELKDYEMEWHFDSGKQIKLALFLPTIKDLNTALICCKAYNKAHVIYINKNKTRTEDSEEKIKKYYNDVCKYLNVE